MTACVECGGPNSMNGKLCFTCCVYGYLRRPLALKAHAAVAKAVKAGALPRLSVAPTDCVDCGKRATDYDHRDYEKPLEVEPVCRRCNIMRPPALPYRETGRFYGRNAKYGAKVTEIVTS